MFTETLDVIPFEDRSRRKFGNPIIADLDQDGLLDLLLTEHSLELRLYWNKGKSFSQPTKIYGGDSHGVAVGDYDLDGKLNLVVSQGGGDGKNPRNPVWYKVSRDREVERGEEFSHFVRSRGRAVKFLDLDRNGSLDLFLSAFPLKEQTEGANNLYRNDGRGEFTFLSHLPRAQWMGFRTLLTDFNDDQETDVVFYGGNNMVFAKGLPDGGFEDVSEKWAGVAANTTFVSSVSEIDFDNDGDLDLFLTRSDHPFEQEVFFNSKQGRYYFFARREKFQFEDLKIDGDFKLENLQMAYPHFDVFVGAEKRLLEFEVDRHGHKDFVLKPSEAEGWPETMDEKGIFIGHLGDGVWRIAGDTRSGTSGVVHNVISKPKPIKKEPLPAVLLENRDGHFEDVTKRLGIAINEQTTSSVAGDFNNDGWADLFVVRYGSPASRNKQILFLNQKGKWFERIENHGIVSSELGSTGGGAEAFDYDEDGDLDLLYCNEKGRWHLETNNGLGAEDNNFLVVKVGKSPSGKASFVGAVVIIRAGELTWRRAVSSSSAPYGQSGNNHLHFGLGKIDKVDSMEVRWSNGETESVQIDQFNRSVAVGQFPQ